MPDYFFRVSLPIVLIVEVPVWVIVSALKIASGSQLLQREHLYPNEGIRRSGINGLVLGLIVTGGLALPLGLASWLSIQRLTSITVIALPLALIIGLALGLFFGLSDFLRHFVLRFWLWLCLRLPDGSISGAIDLYTISCGVRMVTFHHQAHTLFQGGSPVLA
jgi:hypothetical protein